MTATTNIEELKALSSMLPKEKIEDTEPKNVLAKVMVKAAADDLLDIISSILGAYTDEQLVMTFMIEKP